MIHFFYFCLEEVDCLNFLSIDGLRGGFRVHVEALLPRFVNEQAIGQFGPSLLFSYGKSLRMVCKKEKGLMLSCIHSILC